MMTPTAPYTIQKPQFFIRRRRSWDALLDFRCERRRRRGCSFGVCEIVSMDPVSGNVTVTIPLSFPDAQDGNGSGIL